MANRGLENHLPSPTIFPACPFTAAIVRHSWGEGRAVGGVGLCDKGGV